ncbi:uncharacterized protein TNCV_3033071 [Trichonephila clavipes]|nr:uncharacterized protein TNCV_3033071 [Trichonephila clavipes]
MNSEFTIFKYRRFIVFLLITEIQAELVPEPDEIGNLLLLLSYEKKNQMHQRMQHSSGSGHITDFIGIKGVIAAFGVYVEDGGGIRDAIEVMPRIQLNSQEVPAFCVGSRAVEHDLHTSHVPRPHSAEGNGDNVV